MSYSKKEKKGPKIRTTFLTSTAAIVGIQELNKVELERREKGQVGVEVVS